MIISVESTIFPSENPHMCGRFIKIMLLSCTQWWHTWGLLWFFSIKLWKFLEYPCILRLQILAFDFCSHQNFWYFNDNAKVWNLLFMCIKIIKNSCWSLNHTCYDLISLDIFFSHNYWQSPLLNLCVSVREYHFTTDVCTPF